MNKLKERYIPENYRQYSPEIGDYPKGMFACYVNLEQPHNPRAIFFIGKQSKPTWNYRFSDVVRMKEKINSTISNLMSYEETKEKRKIKKKELLKNMDISTIKIGDIYRWSGGYNCTRNGYVKVISIKGKKCEVAELPKRQVDGDWMNGNVAPVIDAEYDKTISMIIKPAYNGGVMLRNTKTSYKDDYYKWNGQPNWENCD